MICLILPEPTVDGARKRTRRLLEAMERAGVRPHIVTGDPRPEAADALRALGSVSYTHLTLPTTPYV